MTAPIRVAFMGTPELARVVLARLAEAPGYELCAVVAQPDRPAGRSLELKAPAVKVEALARGLPLFQPERARQPEFIDLVRSWNPQVIVVAAYGQILPQALLEIPSHGCLNIHTSLLPRWRGAAPIQWAIASGDAETGVTLMRMDAGLDTGPIVSMARTPIRPEDDSAALHDRLAQLGGDLLIDTLPGYLSGMIQPKPQPTEGVTIARKITREDGRIEWNRPALELWHHLRGFTPWPGLHAMLPAEPRSKLVKVLTAHPGDLRGTPGSVMSGAAGELVVACGTGSLHITELQLEGGRPQTASQFLAGNRPARLE